MSWDKVSFTEVVSDITRGNSKFQSTEYLQRGQLPIIDQSELFIGGYTNENKKVKRNGDVVIFGDHTKTLKYVNFDFCLGADGVKVLEPSNKLDAKYLYYYLQTIDLPNVGYSRHFKFLKEIQIPLPPLPVQKRIAEILDAADALRRKDQELLKKYDELAQAIFIDMFGDPVKNEKGWEVKKLDSILKIDTKAIDPNLMSEYNYIGLEHIEKETGKILSIENGKVKSNKFIFTRDHILYGKLRPYLNKVASPVFDGICSTDIFPILPLQKEYKSFIITVLRSKNFVNHSNDSAVGANLPRSNKESILNFKTIIPTKQIAIEYHNRIESIIKSNILINKNLSNSNELFEGILQHAFSGELVA